MTCREKLKIEHPEDIDPKCAGGCHKCPHDYGYMEKPKECVSKTYFISCTECWDREIPEAKAKPTFAIGGNAKPSTLTIECETITLKQKEIGIEFDLGNAHFDNIGTIVINGHIFKKEN